MKLSVLLVTISILAVFSIGVAAAADPVSVRDYCDDINTSVDESDALPTPVLAMSVFAVGLLFVVIRNL